MKEQIDLKHLPRHVAIIMDGNGRWAQKNGKSRFEGHQEGVVSVRKVVEVAGEIGIKYMTVYTFSTENWNRPQEEVDALMALMVSVVQRETPDLMKQNVRLLIIGDVERLPQITKDNLLACVEETGKNTGLRLILAISYSSRWEITEAVRSIVQKAMDGKLEAEKIDETMFSNHLTTKDIPDPDLLIRTGGDYRISNYLLWQMAYTELFFTPVYWPEFRENQFYEAILDFQKRERRFGKTGEQVKSNK